MVRQGKVFVRMVAGAGLGGPVLEIGSRPARGQRKTANLRSSFPGLEYTGVDILSGPGVDVTCDGATVGELWPAENFAIGLCLDTLEHCRYPEAVVNALCSVCRSVAIRAPFAHPLHYHPDDFWRFAPSILREWLSPRYAHGLVAQDAPIVDVSDPLVWPSGVYGFGTADGAALETVWEELHQGAAPGIHVIKTWRG